MDEIPLQRALVLQGGGALGAYEAGVFKILYEQIKYKDRQRWSTHLYDIVAGASIGAINAAALVDYFLKNNNSWCGSADYLYEFWNELKNNTITEWNGEPISRWGFEAYWNFLNAVYPAVASGEGARRYWSWVQLANTPYLGAKNLSLTRPQIEYKFMDPNPFNSSWLGYDYSPLKEFLARKINFPIKTYSEKAMPRLLLVGVDVEDCTEAVTFDSYAKDDGKWHSEYEGSKQGRRVSYDGITLDQLLASCLFPYSLTHTKMVDENSGKERTYWDGAFLSNTPLREVLHHHRDYWLKYFAKNNIDYRKPGEPDTKKPKVPDLDVYIVNLYPATEAGVPRNLDAIRDREIDINFHDRTRYDEHMAHLISDYISLAEEFMKLAKEKNASQKEIDKVLDTEIEMRSAERNGTKRNLYRNLLDGRFKVNVRRIDRADDGDTIFGKHADFSTTTIERLIKQGERDAGQLLGVKSTQSTTAGFG